MNQTTIAWTEKTWNPITGCRPISPGCKNCYARRFAERFRGVKGHPYEHGFDLQFHHDRLDQPSRWKKPSMIFVCSMSDLFQKDVPAVGIGRVFSAMFAAPQHTYQVLTKRAGRMRDFVHRANLPRNIWLGVTAEDQIHAQVRSEALRQTRASVRFLSIEPMLGPIKLQLDGIHWVIVGGESGPGFRPMDPAWALDVRDQCAAAGVPFFFKQHSGIRPAELGHELDGQVYREMPR